MKDPLSSVCCDSFLRSRFLASVRPYLSKYTCLKPAKLVTALITSRLDHCNSDIGVSNIPNERSFILTRTHSMHIDNNLPSTELATKLNQNKISFFLSHFSSFLTVYLLSVVLWLDKGDFPENVHTVCSCQRK